MPRFVFAVDSLKGTLSSEESERILAAAARRAFPGCTCVSVPIADGGEGTLDAVRSSVPGARLHEVAVTGPLREPTTAQWLLLPDGRALIELAQAAGLTLVPEQDRDPTAATTLGVGQLVSAALDAGARDITLAVGGSATNDGGLGLLAALGWCFRDETGEPLPPVGASLGRVTAIDGSGSDPRLSSAAFHVMCDVANPLCGPAGCAAVFAPQKGATPAQVRSLDEGMSSFAEVACAHLGFDRSEHPGAGAAGGVGFAAQAFLDADFVLGIDALLDMVGFEALLEGADLVVTGEGRLDTQTEGGKAVAGVAARAAAAGVPCVALCGAVEPGARIPGLAAAESTVTAIGGLGRHLARAGEAYEDAADRLFALLAVGAGFGA